MTYPFSILGVSSGATPEQLRTAFRRLALRHHPDRNPGDDEAARRFTRILRAYRDALRTTDSAQGKHGVRPAGPRPDRYGCGSCGDTFPFPERCPRCALDLSDRHAGEPEAPSDPRVDAWVSALERRPPIREDAPDDVLPAPRLLVGTFLGAAGVVWTIGGPLGPALLFAGFAAYVAAVEGYRIFEPLRARRP